VKGRYLIPLGVFAAMAGLFGYVLVQMNQGDYNPRDLPSALINKPAPEFSLPDLHDPEKRIGKADFVGQVSLFNVWASWCVACRQEHPFFMELARQKTVPLYGLNYKDKRPDALRWLSQLGDPYTASAFDEAGRVGIDWGVYGVPETFVVDRRGVIRYKHIGPVSPQAWEEKIRPLVEQLRSEEG